MTFHYVLRVLNHPVVVELRWPAGGDELFPACPGDPPLSGMLVLRVEGGLYTMNVRRVQDQIYDAFESREPNPHVVLVDVGATVDTSVTVIDAWLEIDQYLASRGAGLWVAAIPPRAVEKVKRIDIYREWLDAGRIHPSVRVAVDRFESARSGGIQS